MARTVHLPDGTALRVRPITPADRDAFVEGFAKLSPESRYRRFFSLVSELSERQLDYLTDVDHHNHEALGAECVETGEGIAVARFVRTHDDIAEPAIVVLDDWQRRGVATVLLSALADRAREEGITTFVAPVLARNTGAINLFRRLGDVTLRSEGTEVELTIPLGTASGAPPSLQQVLHQVAAGTVRPALTFWQRLLTTAQPPRETRNTIVVGVPETAGAVVRVGEIAATVANAYGANARVVAAQRFLLDDRAELDERSRRLCSELEARGVDVEVHTRRGDLAAALLDQAVESGARMIVADGAEPHAAPPLLGSVWDHLAHHAPCDVLIAR